MEIYPVAQGIVDSQTASEREVCKFLGIARSPFQRWKQLELSPLEQEDRAVLPSIVKCFHAHRRRYGTRRIMEDLRDQGLRLSRRRIAKLMKIAGISAIQPKSFKPRTTDSKHSLGYNENLIMNLPDLTGPNQLWVGDITYISIREIGF
ncbi:MAG: IS3 family transposase, partial [Planctomycetota bacterium]